MSVFKRKTSNGVTEEYHYRFMQGGKLYYGVCENCTKLEAAQDFEKIKKATAKNLTAQKSVKALVENFKEELSGGEKIELKEAYDLSLKKPRRFKSSDTQKAVKRSYWRDFILYMGKHYPESKYLSDVHKRHAEEYIQYIRDNGRFDKTVMFSNTMKKEKGDSSYSRTEKKLSARSINMFHMTISEVFVLLERDSGMIENPFDGIPKVEDDSESRESFVESELKLIRDNWDEFIRRIFMTGFFTAMREGDICTLKIKEVLFDVRVIRRKTLKTGKIVEIPLMAPFESFLREQIALAGDSEYVFPDLAKMYLSNPSGISYRVKSFLEGLGIKTTKKIEGRDREISVKDVHSLRHTFCYLAGLAGIPLVIVQSIVGHMTKEMTAHYMAHADRTAKHEKMLLLPDLMNVSEKRDSRIENKRKLLLDHIAAAGAKELRRIEKLVFNP